MVFQSEAQFQQFIHCKFRENIIRILYIPTATLDNDNGSGMTFLVVNKYGKVGLYDCDKWTLLQIYILDLSVPSHLTMNLGMDMDKRLSLIAKKPKNEESHRIPRCERTHLVVDAVFCPDIHMVLFATTKNMLQCYDIGEIENYTVGLDLFPRKEALGIKHGQAVLPLKNKGHSETHRIYGLREIPYCLEYCQSAESPSVMAIAENIQIRGRGRQLSRILIGDRSGCITIITIEDSKCPFGFRKIRGVLHEIKLEDLIKSGTLHVYQAHFDIVREIRHIKKRHLIISCSRDTKFSLFVKDFTETTPPYIISLPKGVNTFCHCDPLKIIATGSSDGIIRLFNQFVMKMPQMELLGHKSPIVALEFILVPFSQNPILISYSSDVEIRAWDPNNFSCLQSAFISFPLKSSILCKTPEFAKRSIFVHQPHYEFKSDEDAEEDQNAQKSENDTEKHFATKKSSGRVSGQNAAGRNKRGEDGFLIVFYCNSYARLFIEKETSYWPFDFEDFVAEFQEIGKEYKKKHLRKENTPSKHPKTVGLTKEEISAIESKLDGYVEDILRLKRTVDKTLEKKNKLTTTTSTMGGLAAKRFYQIYQGENENETPGSRSGETQTGKTGERSNYCNFSGCVFKNVPLYEIEPVKFSTAEAAGKWLPVTDTMREFMKIDQIQDVNDLLSDGAKKCFSKENVNFLNYEAEMTGKTFPAVAEKVSGGNSRRNQSSDPLTPFTSLKEEN